MRKLSLGIKRLEDGEEWRPPRPVFSGRQLLDCLARV
jgi:hypothetical protein